MLHFAPQIDLGWRHSARWLLASSLLLCLSSPAQAQVTNQSDTSGVNPDFVYPALTDLSELFPGRPDLVQTADELATRIGEKHEACLLLFDPDAPTIARSTDNNPCDDLNHLLQQARELLAEVNAAPVTQEDIERLRDQQIW